MKEEGRRGRGEERSERKDGGGERETDWKGRRLEREKK